MLRRVVMLRRVRQQRAYMAHVVNDDIILRARDAT